MGNRREKMEEALREAAAEFLNREAGRQSMVTVTRAELSDNGARANVMLTVLPEAMEEEALEFANRRRADFADFFKKRVRAQMPRVQFLIDRGDKNRRRLDELSN